MTVKIPKAYTFPGSYKVLIKQVSKEYFEGQAWVDAEATWVSTEKTIYLREDTPYLKKKQDLLHELEHAWVDAKLELERKFGLSEA